MVKSFYNRWTHVKTFIFWPLHNSLKHFKPPSLEGIWIWLKQKFPADKTYFEFASEKFQGTLIAQRKSLKSYP